MEPKTTDICLLEDISSVEEFLRSEFHASSNKLKKHFKKSFLGMSFVKRNILSLPIDFVNDGEINPSYEGQLISVIHEDEDFFVFSKNPNQFIHPLTYSESDNCLSYIRQTRPDLLAVNVENYDRGLLYRLDYETSGVVIYAKTTELYKKLRENFNTIAKEKIYLCWVDGNMSLTGPFVHYFNSGEAKGKRVKVSDKEDFGMRGELSVRPLEHNKALNMTLVEVKLKSGLRHQIRAQMAHLGFPLKGDKFYGGSEASRLYLHASTYKIDLGSKQLIFHSESHNFNGL